MHDYRYDHVHLRSPDPDATARFFETMFGPKSREGFIRLARSIPGSSGLQCGWAARLC